MKKIQAAEVAAISMEFGELELYLWISIGSQKISMTWLDLKFLSHKIEEGAKLSQQLLLNLEIICKIYSTLNWTWKYVKTMLVPWGV